MAPRRSSSRPRPPRWPSAAAGATLSSVSSHIQVREPDEFERARIEGSTLIPLGELGDRVGELADWKDRPIVVHCKSGGRSADACRLLRERGFTDVANLSGGIEAWSLTVDPSVPRY